MNKSLGILAVIALSCFATFGANYAVTFYSGDTTGIPDGWPKDLRPLGGATGPLNAGEQLKTDVEIEAIRAPMSAVMAERKLRMRFSQLAPTVLAESVKQRLAGSEFQSLKIDAMQSELTSLLVQAYIRNTRLLQLVTKAVAGTSATNNLTAGERALVQTIRSELVFGDGDPVTAADKQRFTDIRDGALKPHYQLYLAAKAVVDAWRTNAANAPDPYSPTNLPSVTIGE